MQNLDSFIAASEESQCALLAILSKADVRKLHNAYLRWAIHDASQDNRRTWSEMQRRIEPDEHDEFLQGPELREALKPAALQRLREDTYEESLRPMLHASAAAKDRLLKSSSIDERRALLKLLGRYAREYGRSPSFLDMERRVKLSLESS